MPPPLPERYRLEVRVGSDEDVEQWLGTDVSLERPVLVRILGPESDDVRRGEFLRAVQDAATVNHAHIATIFTAGTLPDGAFSVSEWTGGMTLADRLRASLRPGPAPLDLGRFLPNAVGLAAGLALLHRSGAVHGSVDAEAILYSETQPAKLASFGRRPRSSRPADDVAALAGVISLALTGSELDAPPSEIVDGLDPAVDGILAAARAGELDAGQLSIRLAAVPAPTPLEPLSATGSRRLLGGVAALLVAAVLLVVTGRIFLVDPGVAVPDLPARSQPEVTLPPLAAPARVPVLDVFSVDPFGDGTEGERRLPNLIDGDLLTAWRTETYRSPLPLLKPGVGVGFHLAAPPSSAEIVGATAGTLLTVTWDDSATPDPASWEILARVRLSGEAATVALPAREAGTWALWLEELTEVEPGSFFAEVAEVRFLP